MWTGDKRRRTIGGPSPRRLGPGSSSDDTTDATPMLMDDDSDTRPQVEEEQGGQEPEKEFLFSAEDVIDLEEFSRCGQELLSRERPIYIQCAHHLSSQGISEVYQRFLGYRFRDYKRLKEGSLNWDDTTAAVPASEYPDEVYDWEDPSVPGPSILGWTYDPDYFELDELDDYQRIVLTTVVDEYYDWKKYCTIFSCYEADEEYVKYWDQLSKQMKWVEDALPVDHRQFLMYDFRASRQAMKIATGFCHLPLYLATLGYEEYVLALRDDLDRRKGYDLVYFEVWKRMSKKKMSFKEALKDTLSVENKLPSLCLFKIKNQIGCHQMHLDFNICMGHIQKLVIDGGEVPVLKHFTDAVYSKIPRPKMYVDYAKKKLEVVRRIHLLIPGMGSPQRIENRQSNSENRTVC